jgi:hypothetical protein
MERIMSIASNLDHRELTDTQLDAVSGGSLSITKPLDAASTKNGEVVGGGGGDVGPAIAVWNKLLGKYGY